nr:hypothetical protein [Tanacetum cinerariifolium]
DPESLIRRRNLVEPSSLFDFEDVMSIPHNNQGPPPPAGPPPPNNNGPPPVEVECEPEATKDKKFTFPDDFVVVNYDADPPIPLILGRPFLRTAHALVDVHREELILRDSDKKLIFHAESTSKHPHKHGNESINMINFIDITCEDRFPKVLKFKKSNYPLSANTNPLSDSSPSLTPFETSDSLIEEFAVELTLLDPFPSRNKYDNFDFRDDLRKIKYLLNQDPSPKSNIETIDPILEKFTDEPALDYLPSSGDDDDDLFDLKYDNDEWKKLLYGDCYKDIDFEKDKNKYSKMKLLIVESNDVLPQLLDNDSILLVESSVSYEIASLSSSPFGNEDKDYKVNTSSGALLVLEERNIQSISSDKELQFFLELTVIETLLSFSFENEDKVFNPGILVLKGVHSFTLRLSHRTYETFKIINVHPNIFNEDPMKIFPSFVSAPRTKEFSVPDMSKRTKQARE